MSEAEETAYKQLKDAVDAAITAGVDMPLAVLSVAAYYEDALPGRYNWPESDMSKEECDVAYTASMHLAREFRAESLAFAAIKACQRSELNPGQAMAIFMRAIGTAMPRWSDWEE